MRKIILLLASLFLLLSCEIGVGKNSLEQALFPEPDNRIPADFLGCIAGENGISSGGIDAARAATEYDFVDYLGARWILRTFYWKDIETSNDVWDFGFYDNFVQAVHDRGFKIFAVLAYENNAVTGDSGRYISEEKYPLYARYVTKIIERYGDKIAGYSIWNEPNENPRFWIGKPEEIIKLTAYAATAARTAINQHNPKGVLAAGVLNSLAIDDWTEGFFSGAMLNTDAVAYHPYMPGAQRAADLFSEYQALVSKYGYAGKIWITEAGFPTGGRYVSRVEEKNMPQEVIKTITLLAARGAARVFWYALFDDPTHDPENSEDWFGLANYDSATNVITKKNGADAFALCGKYIPGTVYRPDLPSPAAGGGIQAYCFEGPETSALILWADTKAVNDTIPVTVTLPGSDQTRYNIETGAPSAADETTEYAVGKAPIFLTWKPAAGSVPSVSTP